MMGMRDDVVLLICIPFGEGGAYCAEWSETCLRGVRLGLEIGLG